ncbi:cobalamin B12-binding domain-containing protein [Rhodobacter calidifons]|uniref:Cobalamin B12-binding domain-containing protein n=1 Tax=Rhodobacter calidifons TaxID=2715277 RepID=A0ABX0G764_9RHOB|nr:cobalamin B12-binding domain-containing protein [Rhodobacter calidifons]NHB76969.1 cobalamin B12-binding domain-containing protein [Rhodobacter calidifons]
MRDNGIADAEVDCGHDTFADLAREALNRLVSVRGSQSFPVRREHLDRFMLLLAPRAGFDAARVLEEMARLKVTAAAVACGYVPEAARLLGEQWEADEISFVDVTIRAERLHEIVRRVDEDFDVVRPATDLTALVLVAEAEQHTLGAFVLALQLRAAGFGVVVRVAPVASELTQLLSASRFDLALVSLGCTAAMESGMALIRTLRLLSREDICIFVGGAIPVPDDRLLQDSGADRVVRDVSALLAEYEGCKQDLTLDLSGRKVLKLRRMPAAKGDGVGLSR